MRPLEHLSNINVAAGFTSTFVNFTPVSETFHQLSVRPRDLSSTSINILSVRGKHFVRKLDLTSDNFLCGRGSLHQVFVHQQDLQSSTVNNPCGRGLPSICVNFLCGRRSYRQLSVHPRDLSSTFRASEVPSINFPYIRGRSINFRQLSVHPREYPSNFCVSGTLCHLQ